MPKISIIILSYNTKKLTKQCLTSLLNALRDKDIEYEVIIVDNASNDGSVEMLESYQVNKVFKIIKNKTNVGFAKANNQALKIASGKYILFLNSDVIINNLEIKKLLNYLDCHPEIGVITVRVNLVDSSIDPASHRGFPTIWNSFCYFTGFEKIFSSIPLLNKIFGGYHMIWNNLETIHEIDSPSGAFYLSRKKILKEINGFDEDFFMYGEDLDLSFRIKKHGYKIVYYPFAQVTHLKYKSGLKTSNTKVKKEINKHFFEAMKIFYKKHYAKNYPHFFNKIIYAFIDIKSKI